LYPEFIYNPIEEWVKVIQMTFTWTFLFCKKVLLYIIKKSGAIINVVKVLVKRDFPIYLLIVHFYNYWFIWKYCRWNRSTSL
jgi:hypothetical protein